MSGWIHSFNASEMYLETTYTGNYRSSPFVFNFVAKNLIGLLNNKYLRKMSFDLNDLTFGLFRVEDPILNYYDNYLGIGVSANFKNTTTIQKNALFHRLTGIDLNQEPTKPPEIDPLILQNM